ncbi:hypothetical protein A1Q2_04058 [Trichosporon asahii var. asahii CBS 8904]|uniref:Uncharacterized protein n=1 Tax=Trichosporon asahii var. asahii (strain CBS 8904) TaxID=1220162 RepID=K1VQL7_TRIAC|nr:hypothetical protein A1Q2_04058 [Trichosporon asahii var. asahii CBS 8904]
MEQYLKSTWNAGSADYVPSYNDVLPAPPMEDQLLVKAGPNAPARPLHMFMAPLTLDSMPVSPPPSKRIDMRLAQPGTEESKPGYLTPLAQYTGLFFPPWTTMLTAAQTFWYFWYADIKPNDASSRRFSDSSLSDAAPFDLEGRPQHPIQSGVHSNQLQPNLTFCQFVFSALHSTQVSFSVTILALMYTYKYKKIVSEGKRQPYKHEVSEAQGFITGLMLANKYLDDNTYTNTTWAQFLGIPVKDVNEYELEWLDALEFNLCVTIEDFELWRSMLDAHIRCRQRLGGDGLNTSPFSAGQPLGRARSASPPLLYDVHGQAQGDNLGKRTARDAFATDVLHTAGMYEAARLWPKKSTFNPLAPAFPMSTTALPTPAPASVSPNAPAVPTLARSSSLNRQIARLPTGRRESFSNELPTQPQMDLRHAAAAATAQNWGYLGTNPAVDFGKPNGAGGWGVPAQPRLYFLQAAATPQFGPDGRYHKAIPHYFDAPYGSIFDPPTAQAPAAPQAQYEPEALDGTQHQINLSSPTNGAQQMGMASQPAFPGQQAQQTRFGNPQPAPFANAGPPGYAYGAPSTWLRPIQPPQQHQPQPQQPLQSQWQRAWKPGHNARWSTCSDDGFVQQHLRPPPICSSAAEWPTPVYAAF